MKLEDHHDTIDYFFEELTGESHPPKKIMRRYMVRHQGSNNILGLWRHTTPNKQKTGFTMKGGGSERKRKRVHGCI
jgi:hypothetical protein